MDYGTQEEMKPEHLCRADMCGGERVKGSELCSMHKSFADEREAKRAKQAADTQRLADLDTLDAHVKTLHGGSYWSSSEDSCGVHDAACPENDWHRHGRDENDARHQAAEHIRNTPRCPYMSGWGTQCNLPAGHPSEGHLVSA